METLKAIKKTSHYKNFPGSMGLPIIGQIPELLKDIDAAIKTRYEKYGRVFVWKPLNPIVALLGAEANEFLLSSHQKSFSAKLIWEVQIGVLFRGGLLTKDGSEHKKYRRIIMPAFKKAPIKSYLKFADPIIQKTVESWEGRVPDIYTEIKHLTLQVAVGAIFGIHEPDQIPLYNRLITDIVAGSIAFVKIPVLGRTYRKALDARYKLIELLQPIVKDRRQGDQTDMISQLCRSQGEDGEILTDEEVIDQILFIMMAAHDTTASSMTSIMYELAKNPEWQERLYEECSDSQAEELAPEEAAEKSERARLVIKEVLRMHTPLKVIPRVAIEPVSFGEWEFSPGTAVAAYPCLTHFMEEYWEEPTLFDPLRFSRGEPKNSFAYIPFGRGTHSCLGQGFAEQILALMLYRVVARRTWRGPDIENLRFDKVPIQVPHGDFPLEFEKR